MPPEAPEQAAQPPLGRPQSRTLQHPGGASLYQDMETTQNTEQHIAIGNAYSSQRANDAFAEFGQVMREDGGYYWVLVSGEDTWFTPDTVFFSTRADALRNLADHAEELLDWPHGASLARRIRNAANKVKEPVA